MAKGLTEKQKQVLDYIIEFQGQNGFPPTIREMGDAFGIGSLRGVTVHLDALVRKGFITRERGSRSIHITAPDSDAANAIPEEAVVRLPLIRSLTAREKMSGKNVAQGQIERYIFVPEEMAAAATGQGFLIRVGATGVHGEPICPGDLVIVRPQTGALPGDLVVTLTYGEFAVTRASETGLSGDGTALRGNEVMGRVVGLIRRY